MPLPLHPIPRFSLILVSILSAALTSSAAPAPPNFIVIFVDDLGYADTGFNGATDIRTPVLDRLADQGVNFTNGYVTAPYCGPSRAGLLTGRHQSRFGLDINPAFSPFDLNMGLPLTEQTFGDYLKEAGYRTGVIGKWHMGAAPPYHPNNRGFDYFYGFLGGGHFYFPGDVSVTRPLYLEDGRLDKSANAGYFLPLLRNDNAAEFDEYLTTALSRDAVRFIEESEGPFCLYLAYNAPHAPYQAPEEAIQRNAHIADPRRRVYAAMVDVLDEGIGMVVDALEEKGVYENTLIFFLSDNGGIPPPKGRSDNGPLRAGKGSFLEGGIKVPFIAHWPDGIPAGLEYEGIVSALDIAATMVSLSGQDPADFDLEGMDLIPYLADPQKGQPARTLYWRAGSDASTWAIRTNDHKMVKPVWNATEPELFDMRADPYESENLIEERPDLRADLADRWNEWNERNALTVLPQASQYQVLRMQFYDDLYEERKAQVEKRGARSIE